MDTIGRMNDERLTAFLAFIDRLCHYLYYRKLLIFNILYIIRNGLILIGAKLLIIKLFSLELVQPLSFLQALTACHLQ
jgi:hypothetical protein